MPRRAVIVEDEAVVALDVAQALQKAGLKVARMVSTAAEALRTVERACQSGEPPDVVVLDIGLRGDLDGIETAARLRDLYGPELAIIFITGYGDSWTRSRAEAFKPAAYLTKPFGAGEMLDALRSVPLRARQPERPTPMMPGITSEGPADAALA